MDLYDPDFRDYVAVDSRIEGVFEAAGNPLEGLSYEEKQSAALSIAEELEMEPWELDRMLYNFHEEIKERL